MRKTIKISLILSSLCILYPILSEAIRVFAMQELEGKIIESKVQEIYLTDTGIEGFYDNDGIRSPFIIFGKFEKIPDHLLQLSSKYGVNIIQEAPKKGKNIAKIDIRIIFSIIYLASMVLILMYLISINKKLKEVFSIVSQLKK